MADSGDLTVEVIARRIAGQYAVLQISCEMLPVPIALPEAAATLSNLDTVPAVRRVVDLAEEQPMPEEIQAHLFTAAIFWLTAMDLLGIILANEWSDSRGYQALGALSISGDALKDLGSWLIDQE